jgi:hypothetical protein
MRARDSDGEATESVSYFDDPADPEARKLGKPQKIIGALSILIAASFFINTTLAADISLNNSQSIQFGQGITQTAACSGATNLTITPNSTFTNVSGGGGIYFSSVTVSNIPSSCQGDDFILSAYDNSNSTPLALFNSNSTNAVVYNNAGTFEAGVGTTGMSVTSGSGSFTATFTNPVALSSTVFRITIQSTQHAVASCAQGGICAVGDTGPGGGTVFYVAPSVFTETGAPCASTCRYLEAASNTWYGGSSDPALAWSADSSTYVGITNQAIGAGFSNTNSLITFNSTSGYAMTAARAYRGPNNLSDWFLGSYGEMDKLAIYSNARGNVGFGSWYWVSSEQDASYASYAWVRMFYSGGGYQGGWKAKSNLYYVRPIRAF